MNSFKIAFEDAWRNLPSVSGKMEANIYRNNKNIDYICFVEGPSDPVFYKNITNTNISNKNLAFVRCLTKRDKEYDGEEIGKEGVLRNYYSLLSDKVLSRNFNKYIFIVYNDYEGLVSENGEIEECDCERINVTPCYAFENFFLTDENIKIIFSYFGLSNDDSNKFIKKLNSFVQEISEYNRLKSSTVIAYKYSSKYNTPTSIARSTFDIFDNYNGCYRKCEQNDIFNFEFTGKYPYYYRKSLYDKQIELMKNSVANNKTILFYYKFHTQKFVNNRDFVRGHDLYNFLSRYLLQLYDINIFPRIKNNGIWIDNPNYISIIKLLVINFNFKNGLNEFI